MDTSTGPVRHRRDYRPPDFRVEHVELAFDIGDRTRVTADLQLARCGDAGAPLVLDGRQLALLAVELDGVPLPAPRRALTETGLRIPDVPDRFRLRVVTQLDPDRNLSMEGLYRSGPMLCTQCEAHGFSRMTFFPDRPDVLATFKVRIEAARAAYPVLLANGNCVEQGEAGGGRHYAVWHDPLPKPCYLFALVAGDLARVAEDYATASGRRVQLEFFVDHGNEPRVPHALESLKQAMRWDEQTYGLEYDLERYMVVAARDFNMGAMENKGLNLFNAAYVLASPETATDADYENIQAVIGHEYFHNWTGNRVTCRDWFQLSLKEGLTVFREQQFSAAMSSPGVRRIQQARLLRARQFPEDAGPLAHPVRPESYLEVNNFYTATVYEKGAELIRMIETVIGTDAFIAGVQDYLRRHDGTAATIEDFLAAHERAGGRSLDGFRLWYSQAGTPELTVEDAFEDDTYILRLKQRTPPTPGQLRKAPVPIPIRFALRDPQGARVAVRSDSPLVHGDLLLLESESAEVRFSGLNAPPLPSLLRGFSAPVHLRYAYTDAQLAMLLQHDDDAFVRWEAAQRLMLRAVAQELGRESGSARRVLLEALGRLAAQGVEDKALLAELLRLPSESYLLEEFAPVDPQRLGSVHDALRLDLARALTGPLSVWAQCESDGAGAANVGRRALSNLAVWLLAPTGADSVLNLALNRATQARTMTLKHGALWALKDVPGPQREAAFAAFLQQSGDDGLLVDKWFALQAAAVLPDAVPRIERLLEHPQFDRRNPNRVRAVLGTFARENPRAFHAPDGAGYRLLTRELLALDRGNPQLSARLCDALMNWQRQAEPQRSAMRAELEALRGQKLSPDLGEKVEKALAS